jgi:uncharacterized protein (TIGR03905 family)
MAKYEFVPSGVCSKKISFRLDENQNVRELQFVGGCQGNLKALGIVLDGMSAEKVISLLSGNNCGNRGTSCADQLSRALKLALKNERK